MRGSKAKAIRSAVRQLVSPESVCEPTQYDVKYLAPKRVNGEIVYPVQRTVKSEYRRAVLDTKAAYKNVKSQTIPQSALQL